MSNYAEAQYTIDEVKSSLKSGVAPSFCQNLFALQDEDDPMQFALRWTDPEDTYIDGQLITTWAKTVVVRKYGGYPESISDGITVLENAERNAYKSKGSEYTATLYSGESTDGWYFMAFPVSDGGVVSINSRNHFADVEVYGFKKAKNDDDPATRVTYIEGTSAEGMTPAYMDYTAGEFNYGSWDPDSIWFLHDNYAAMVGYDGVEDYRLCDTDYTLKEDGVTASDVSDTSYEGNCMAKIPLTWLYQYEDDDYQYCYVASKQINENYKAYAHMREDQTVMDYIWLSAFDGSNQSSVLRSIKGLTPINTVTGTNEILYAQANGDLWYTRTWSQINLLLMLLILMGCSTDLQTTYGNGHYTGGSAASNLLKTGTISGKGQFYGTNGTGVAVKVFHIENLWGNSWDRIAGMVNDNGNILVKMYPPYNTTGDGYESTGLTPAGTSGGYISQTHMSELGMIPYYAAGSSTTYECDGLWYSNSQVDYAFVGGSCDNGLLVGGFALNLAGLVSAAAWNIGASLSCEQPLSEAA